ncbi:hypothetical protein [Mycolicibacterium phlei]
MFLRDPADWINNLDSDNDVATNLSKNRVYNSPPTSHSDKHSFDNYITIARWFDMDPKWTDVKQAINNFSGSTIASNPKPAPAKSIWPW